MSKLFANARKKLVISIAVTKFCRTSQEEPKYYFERVQGVLKAIVIVRYKGNKTKSEPIVSSAVVSQFVLELPINHSSFLIL
jgi:hypothetical protein